MVQNLEQVQKHVQNVGEEVRLFIHSSLSLELFKMYRHVQIVMEKEKLIKK